MTTTNTYGRQVVAPLTNKSGGAVAAGDVVIVDTGNNAAFTTTTTGAYTSSIGIAQETIANNATGRVLLSGYAALVNVNASVTRGNFVKTHTVAKQGTDAGASRVAGTFGIFLTGGTTPDALIWQPDLGGGSGLTDPMTTRGDIIVRNSSNATARLAIGTTGKVLMSDGTDVAWTTPIGTWTAYTPSVTGSTTNPTLGSSTVTGRYKLLDSKTLCVMVKMTITTGGAWNAGSGEWAFSLPAGMTSGTHDQLIAAQILDSGTRRYAGTALVAASGTTIGFGIAIADAGALGGAPNTLTNNQPVTWATGDTIYLSGIIELT